MSPTPPCQWLPILDRHGRSPAEEVIGRENEFSTVESITPAETLLDETLYSLLYHHFTRSHQGLLDHRRKTLYQLLRITLPQGGTNSLFALPPGGYPLPRWVRFTGVVFLISWERGQSGIGCVGHQPSPGNPSKVMVLSHFFGNGDVTTAGETCLTLVGPTR
ncbi:MAG: hypothetical protein ACUVWA_14345 [Candidatus Oleimicrobiaceae bacterium]